MKMNRTWAMPNKNTLEVEPIRNFVQSYVQPDIVSIDPFARDCMICTITNDMNPGTKAQYHMDALEFLQMLNTRGVAADLCVFDPPYSLGQMKRSYESVGLKFELEDIWRQGRWTKERNLINQLMKVGGIVISFGWNTIGMGVERYYKLEEVLLVCHGGAHNDTICIAERKTAHQENLFHNLQDNKESQKTISNSQRDVI